MARTYVSSYAKNFLSLFGLPETGSATPHLNVLVNTWQTVVMEIQKTVNLAQPEDWTVNRKEFVIDAVVDSFHPFVRYGYSIELTPPQVDEKSGFTYQQVIINSGDNNPVATDESTEDWTMDNISATNMISSDSEFAKMCEDIIGFNPGGMNKTKAWAMYQRFAQMQDTIESMRKARKSTNKDMAAWLVFSNGLKVNDWMLKVDDDTIENICAAFKRHLLPDTTVKA